MKLSILLFGCAVLCSSVLRADTISVYSNFDAQNPWNPDFGLTVSRAVAVPFIVSDTGVPGFVFALSDIELAAMTSDTSANPVTVGLYDSSGGFPHLGLELLNASLSLTPGIVTATSSTHPLLISGQEYWVVLSSPVPGVTWNAEGGSVLGAASLGTSGWTALSTYQQGALQVNASLVDAPEPSTFFPIFCALGMGLGSYFYLPSGLKRRLLG
jgi:hypothetical protein